MTHSCYPEKVYARAPEVAVLDAINTAINIAADMLCDLHPELFSAGAAPEIVELQAAFTQCTEAIDVYRIGLLEQLREPWTPGS